MCGKSGTREYIIIVTSGSIAFLKMHCKFHAHVRIHDLYLKIIIQKWSIYTSEVIYFNIFGKENVLASETKGILNKKTKISKYFM